MRFAAAGSAGAGEACRGDEKLQSELLMDLILDTQPAHNVGSLGVKRVIVPDVGRHVRRREAEGHGAAWR